MDFPKNALFKSYGVICLPGIGLAVFDRSRLCISNDRLQR